MSVVWIQPPFVGIWLMFRSRMIEEFAAVMQFCFRTRCLCIRWEWEWETIFTCLYPYTVQTRLSRDQRPTKPVSRLGTGRGVGENLSAIEILNTVEKHTVEKHEWTKKKPKIKFVCSSLNLK